MSRRCQEREYASRVWDELLEGWDRRFCWWIYSANGLGHYEGCCPKRGRNW